jgi:SWI/SNF-related matrix-associated actin-dependent regulator of chromatin subfamily D
MRLLSFCQSTTNTSQLFNQEKLSFPYLPDILQPHLRPLPPIKLDYTIRVDKAYLAPPADGDVQASTPTIYDIRVPLPNPTAYLTHRYATSKSHLADLQTIVRTDDDLALLVQKLNQNLAKDPASFVKRWVSSQQRDLEVILAEATRGGGSGGLGEEGASEEWRKGGEGGLWGSQVARESVGLWLARQSKAH